MEGGSTRGRGIWMAIVAAAVVAIVVLALVLSLVTTSTPRPTVTYNELGFEWNSPPTTMCNTFGISTPGVPFSVNTSSTSNVSWDETCEANSSVPPGTVYVIHAVSMLEGGTIVSSSVPVTIGYGYYSFFNVTFTAPSTSYFGPLLVMITASPG